MINKLVDLLGSEVIAFVVGVFLTKFSEVLMNKYRYYKSNKDIYNVDRESTIPGMMSLEHAIPFYLPKNMLVDVVDEKFYLAFPEDVKEYVRVKDDLIFNGKTLSELGEEMEIDNFEELVDKHRKIVAKMFIDSKNGVRPLFNGEKLGVRSIEIGRDGKDAIERNQFCINFYTTDYFTHQVMRSIYHELQSQGHPISKPTPDGSCLKKYYPFLTSFGIDSLLIREDENNHEKYIVMMKRSKTLPNMTEDRWHVSMNEGLSHTDYENGKISLSACVSRGYEEELGIPLKFGVDNKFNDLFMTVDDFELGITSVASVIMSDEDFKAALESTAKDRALETVGNPIEIPNTVKDIRNFMKQHKSDMTKVCRYCLKMYSDRMMLK